jgi:hypothetical protein
MYENPDPAEYGQALGRLLSDGWDAAKARNARENNRECGAVLEDDDDD